MQPEHKPSTVAEYIAAAAPEAQPILEEIRTAIAAIVPAAEEAIGYGIPTFKLGGQNLVHFAAFKNHIGFYPTPTGVAAFAEDFKKYKQGKGSIQFPLVEPVPMELIERIVRFRLAEVELKLAKKKGR